jgi:hypothetical protein
MPITAKLSLKFYERFGEDIANELVDWLNQMDTGYRTELREINEHNFARFDAKLDYRLAESDARWERRLAESDARWDHRLAESEVRWDHRLSESEVRWERRLSDLRIEIREVKADLIKWTFVFVAGGTLTVLGFLYTVLGRPQ